MNAEWLLAAVSVCTAASIAYLSFAIWRVSRFRRTPEDMPANLPAATILKPVCGLEPDLYGNLRSFCEQSHPGYQVIFGVRDAADPAIPLIEKLVAEFPDGDLLLCIDERSIGPNQKVSNLANMYRHARHDVIIIADSDMRVGPDYLNAVLESFSDPGTGAVTCLYAGIGAGGVWSRVAAAFINEWFLPSVLVALALQPLKFCFGATMAVRRNVLEEIGGFGRLAGMLADDYMLGRLVSERGYRVRLAPYIVHNLVEEHSLGGVFRHELRWARTVRTSQPLGYAFSFVTYVVPVSLLFLAVSPPGPAGWLVLALAAALRWQLGRVVAAKLGVPAQVPPWVLPLRDLMSFAIWAASFCGRQVQWRDKTFLVQRDGRLKIEES